MAQIMGYRLEWKPGDYCFQSPEHYAKEICKDSAVVHALYDSPVPGHPPKVAVYLGWYWVQPKYLRGEPPPGFIPLYLGPCVSDPDSEDHFEWNFGIIN